jgi:hypothetical protein
MIFVRKVSTVAISFTSGLSLCSDFAEVSRAGLSDEGVECAVRRKTWDAAGVEVVLDAWRLQAQNESCPARGAA